MSESKVFLFDSSDPEIQAAYAQARATFRYFWRELAWERRRIIPGLDLACVKAPFSDGKDSEPTPADQPDVEHMWMSEIDFDGRSISGELLNDPNWLKTVQKGDSARFPLAEISDWMYVIGGEVYGAHTVNLLRSRMGTAERNQHDAAWGLNFGDPKKIRLVPVAKPKGGLLKRLFGSPSDEIGEHPMSENAAAPFAEQLKQNPAMVNDPDDDGWTLLHHQALAGSLATVRVLLDHGADVNAVTRHGMTALQLAEALGWDKVAAMLRRQ